MKKKYVHPFFGEYEIVIAGLVKGLLFAFDAHGKLPDPTDPDPNVELLYFLLEYFAKENNCNVEEMLSEMRRLINTHVQAPTIRNAYLSILNRKEFQEEFRKTIEKVIKVLERIEKIREGIEKEYVRIAYYALL